MKARRFATACPRLEWVVKVAPDIPSGRVSLAACYVELGRLASAWSLYTRLAAGGGPHHATGAVWAKKLAPRLSRLVVTVVDPAHALADLRVACDGVELSPGVQRLEIPVDKGRHVVTAEAKGKERWREEIEVEADGITRAAVIAALRDEPRPSLPPIDVEARIGGVGRLGLPAPAIGEVNVTGGAGVSIAPWPWLAAGIAYEYASVAERTRSPSPIDVENNRMLDTLWAVFRLRAPEIGPVRPSLVLGPGLTWHSASGSETDSTKGPQGTCALPASTGLDLALRGGVGVDVRLASPVSLVVDAAVDYVHGAGDSLCGPFRYPHDLVLLGARAGLAYHFGR